jgi:hypothetical protein
MAGIFMVAKDSMKQAASRPSPVAQPCVCLVVAEWNPIDTELLQGLPACLLQSQIDDIGPEESAHEKFHGQVVDPLHLHMVVGLLGLDPALNQLITHRQRQRAVSVAICCGVPVFYQRVAELVFELRPERVSRQA